MGGQRVSVIIPTYNCADYIPFALQSALAQTHTDREIIVVDDGSTDSTADCLAPYMSQIRYVRQDHAGVAAARNLGFRLAGGDYIALLDADDYWKPRKLEIQLLLALAAPDCGLYVCDGVPFEGEKIVRPNLFSEFYLDLLRKSTNGAFVMMAHRAFIAGPPIGCPAQTLIPRGVVEATGPIADKPIQDYDYYLRISQRYPVAFHHHLLVAYRIRNDSISGPLAGRQRLRNERLIPVLRAHAARCDNDEDRELVAEVIRYHENILARVQGSRDD